MPVPVIDTGVLNLDVEAGVTYSKRWTWAGTATAPDFTGCAARGQVRENYPGTAVLLTFGTAGDVAITLGGTAGWFQIDIDSVSSADLSADFGYVAKSFVWDFEVYDISDPTVCCRPAKGNFNLAPEVTR